MIDGVARAVESSTPRASTNRPLAPPWWLLRCASPFSCEDGAPLWMRGGGGRRRRLVDLVQGRRDAATTDDLIRAGELSAHRGEAGGEKEVPVVVRRYGGAEGRLPAATGRWLGRY